MGRLDEIKAQAAYTGTNLNEYEPSPFTIDTARDLLMLDVPALVAAVEAVLELHALGIGDLFTAEGIEARLEHCVECTQVEHRFVVRYPCPTVAAIRTALGEGEK